MQRVADLSAHEAATIAREDGITRAKEKLPKSFSFMR